jgi:hypothetical protein
VQLLLQLLLLVTVTVYVPAVEIVMLADVAVNPAGPDHKYVPPPVAVNVVNCPKQTESTPVIEQAGNAFTLN